MTTLLTILISQAIGMLLGAITLPYMIKYWNREKSI